MHDRSELEQHRSLVEMNAIIEAFTKDEVYSNTEVRSRIGVAKDVIEEYLPLSLLAQSLPNFKSAQLTPKSHPGPDARLLYEDGSQATVQITCAGESVQTALQRQAINNGQLVFRNQTAKKTKSGEITQNGRALATRAANTRAAIDEVLLAIEKKTKNYQSGTNILLISLMRAESTMSANWKRQLIEAVASLADIPYERVHVATATMCFLCKQNA